MLTRKIIMSTFNITMLPLNKLQTDRHYLKSPKIKYRHRDLSVRVYFFIKNSFTGVGKIEKKFTMYMQVC